MRRLDLYLKIGVNGDKFMSRIVIAFLLGMTFTKTLSQSHKPPCEIDTTILLVNIGDLDNYGLISLLNNLDRKSPKAIGLNAFFEDRELSNDSLRDIIRKLGNRIVIAGSKENPQLSELNTAPSIMFLQEKKGVVTFSFNDNLENGKISESFSLKLLSLIDSVKYKKYIGDTREYNLVYLGNKDCFISINHFQVDDLNDDFLQNRIVLAGYLGKSSSENYIDDSINAFPTPSYPRKKSEPNMYETVIIANIISLALSASNR